MFKSNLYTAKVLTRMLKKCGFNVLQVVCGGREKADAPPPEPECSYELIKNCGITGCTRENLLPLRVQIQSYHVWSAGILFLD